MAAASLIPPTSPFGYADDPDSERLDAALRALEQWHNDNHAGVLRFCDEQPCQDIRRAL